MREAVTAEVAFARNVKAARQRAGLTQAQLSRLLGERFGLTLQRPAIIALENESRRITLNEAMVLAAALDISLLSALVPWEQGEQVSFDKAGKVSGDLGDTWLQVGESVLPPKVARDWIKGDRHGPDTLEPEQQTRFYYTNVPGWLREKRKHARNRVRNHVETSGEIPTAAPSWLLHVDEGEEYQ